MTTTFLGMPHHLVGTAEMAEMFDVSRQMVDRLTRMPNFPEPEIELASGRVWSREKIEKWATQAGRTIVAIAGEKEAIGKVDAQFAKERVDAKAAAADVAILRKKRAARERASKKNK